MAPRGLSCTAVAEEEPADSEARAEPVVPVEAGRAEGSAEAAAAGAAVSEAAGSEEAERLPYRERCTQCPQKDDIRR